MEEKIAYLNRIYSLARARGLCKKQGEFAALLGMNASTISGAMQGKERYLTDNFLRRVSVWAQQMGLEEGTEPVRPAKPKEPDIVIPAATANLYNNMSETIRLQAEIIARLQGGVSTGVNGHTQKNSFLEP